MPVSSGDSGFSFSKTLLLLGFLDLFLEPDSAFSLASSSPGDTGDKQERVENETGDDGDQNRSGSWKLRIRESRLRPRRGEKERKQEVDGGKGEQARC